MRQLKLSGPVRRSTYFGSGESTSKLKLELEKEDWKAVRRRTEGRREGGGEGRRRFRSRSLIVPFLFQFRLALACYAYSLDGSTVSAVSEIFTSRLELFLRSRQGSHHWLFLPPLPRPSLLPQHSCIDLIRPGNIFITLREFKPSDFLSRQLSASFLEFTFFPFFPPFPSQSPILQLDRSQQPALRNYLYRWRYHHCRVSPRSFVNCGFLEVVRATRPTVAPLIPFPIPPFLLPFKVESP